MWKILHTVAFSDIDQIRSNKAHIIDFLGCLHEVLPCVYCRESFKIFMTQMPDVGETIDNGTLDRWMYDMHSRVNQKLGVNDPEYERVKKRYTIRPLQWCPGDVWDLIALFGINYTPERQSHYRVWWENLIPLLNMSGAHRVAQLMKSVECPCTNGKFVATSLVLANAYNNMGTPSNDDIVRRVGKYNLARAKACKAGTCK